MYVRHGRPKMKVASDLDTTWKEYNVAIYSDNIVYRHNYLPDHGWVPPHLPGILLRTFKLLLPEQASKATIWELCLNLVMVITHDTKQIVMEVFLY